MKRRVWAAASAAMMATTAFGAQAVLADKYPNGQVKVFNWGEYIDEDLIDELKMSMVSKLSMIHLIQTRLCIRV